MEKREGQRRDFSSAPRVLVGCHRWAFTPGGVTEKKREIAANSGGGTRFAVPFLFGARSARECSGTLSMRERLPAPSLYRCSVRVAGAEIGANPVSRGLSLLGIGSQDLGRDKSAVLPVGSEQTRPVSQLGQHTAWCRGLELPRGVGSRWSAKNAAGRSPFVMAAMTCARE